MTRLYYLDALRSFCMFFGLFVHAGTLDSGAWPSTTSFFVSEHFRMATFFVISGFFAVMMLGKRGIIGFAQHRALSLVLPLITALVLLNPVTNWLVYCYHTEPVGFWAFLTGDRPAPVRPINWHLHLWFLFSLIAYMVLLPFFDPILKRLGAPVRWLLKAPKDLQIGIIAVLMLSGEIASRIVYAAVFEPMVAKTPVAWLFRGTLQYMPYFLLGALTFHHRALFEALHRISWPTLLVGIGLTVLHRQLGLSGTLDTMVQVVAEEILTVGVLTSLFALARRLFSKASQTVSNFNDAVYSVYLFHYLAIYMLGLWVTTWPLPFVAQFALVIVLAFALTYALHRLVIRRVPLLHLLFNGKNRLAHGT